MSSAAAVRPDHPSLLPALLAADPDSDRVRRSTRDWIVDITAFLIAVGFGAFLFLVTLGNPRQEHPPVGPDVVLGALACLALWWRRRWPVAIALAMLPLAFLSVSSGAAGTIALFTVAVHRPLRVLAPVAGLTWVATLTFSFVFPTRGEAWWISPLISTVILATVMTWGMLVRARRQLVLSLRERALRAEAEQQLRITQARHQERARIAREMHDVLAHRISLLSVHAGALEFRPDAPAEEIARAAGVIRASAHQALQDLREIIGVLREETDGDVPERPQPSLADLPALVEESRRAGMTVRFENRIDDLGAVPAAVGRSVYRTVQEGLTNARKHAPGAAVTVTVGGSAGSGLTVEIRNRLVDAAPEIPGAGAGLIGLTERALLAGGRLEHGRTRDGDFRLRAWLPWPGGGA